MHAHADCIAACQPLQPSIDKLYFGRFIWFLGLDVSGNVKKRYGDGMCAPMRDVTELAAAATGVAHVIEMECSKDFFY